MPSYGPSLAALAALSALTEDYPDTGYVVNLPV